MTDQSHIFHWRGGTWHSIAEADWRRFRAFNNDFAPLPNVTAGDNYFVHCSIEDGRLYQVRPHRYLIDGDGRVADDGFFGVLSRAEGERYLALDKRFYKYKPVDPLTESEAAEFEAIRDRLWRSYLPPIEAARELTRAAIALPDENDAAWHFFEACGIVRSTPPAPSE